MHGFNAYLENIIQCLQECVYLAKFKWMNIQKGKLIARKVFCL